MQPLSVSEFVKLINNLVQIENIAVEGEVSGYSVSQGKFVFFSLKDENAVVECFAMAYAIRVPMADGMRVRVYGTPGLYAKSGRFRVTVSMVELVGDGALKKAFELMKKKLSDEGLFALERKRAIPEIPETIGFIGSMSSAAYSDFVRIVNNRFPCVTIVAYDVRVQGDGAAPDIVEAFEKFNEGVREKKLWVPEVIVLSRGGGSLEDLQAFNDERVARAVYGSLIPVVSAVGHERDETLVDFVADVRASTPSNAAERVVPDGRMVRDDLDQWMEFFAMNVETRLNRLQSDVQRNLSVMELRVQAQLQHVDRAMQTILNVPQMLGKEIEHVSTTIAERERRMDHGIQTMLTGLSARLEEKEHCLNLVNPHALLKRGYSIVYTQSKKVVKQTKDVNVGDVVRIQVNDGTIDATI